MDRVASVASTSWTKARDYSRENPLVTAGGAAVAATGAYLLVRYVLLPPTTGKSTIGLSLGKETNGDSKWKNFASSWSKGDKQAKGGTGAGEVDDPDKAPSLADDFYNFVTDIYEWGWGASFHFAPRLWSGGWKMGEAAQEVRIAHMMRATPGCKVLDVGCGVGGPMRMIAASTGAKVTGVTINEYQVERCKKLNAKAGMNEVCEVVQGDYHSIPFPDGTFDCAFASEATCHSGNLLQVYSEVFRVLKPGGTFVSQEWVSTKLYDAKNDDHVRIIEEINFGNSLPAMRTWEQAEGFGKKAGFKLVCAYDAATILIGPNRPWFERLTQFRWFHLIDDIMIKVLGTLRLIPRTLIDVHTMLIRVVTSLVAGGETGIFTPMYMMCFEKPAVTAGKKE